MRYPGSLHNHSDYSNLRLRDSINTYQGLIDKALELGHECIAITEHESISNAVKVEKYYKKIKKDNPDFKVILGNEIYLTRDGLEQDTYKKGEDKFYHFILLAKDAIGHRQIRELSTKAWLRSWMDGKMRRVPTWYKDLIEIIKSNKGHVIGSTACLGGFLPKLILKNETQKIHYWLTFMLDVFGEGNFYLELQPPAEKDNEQYLVNLKLIELSKQYNIPCIITTDSHYLTKQDAPIHKAYLNSQNGDREVDDFYATTYMMSTEEIEQYFEDFETDFIQECYKNILKIKEQCEDYSLLKPLRIPELLWKDYSEVLWVEKYYKDIKNLKIFYESDYEGDKVLAKAIAKKLNEDSSLRNKETYEAIDVCLDMTWESSKVNNTHWSAYYLNLQNIIDVCWEAGSLVGPGRGSGVGFVLLYLLDIIQINPLRETTQTHPWRFLNPSRVSVLDVDFDIEGSRRGIVLNKFREVYGEDRVANVITFGTEKSKAALQTAARGLGYEPEVGLYLSSLIPADRGMTRTLSQCYYGDKESGFEPIPLFVKEMNENKDIWEVAKKIEGLVCRMGIHAGGVIFVDEPFTNSTGLMRAPDGTIITAFDLHDSEDVSQCKLRLLNT